MRKYPGLNEGEGCVMSRSNFTFPPACPSHLLTDEECNMDGVMEVKDR